MGNVPVSALDEDETLFINLSNPPSHYFSLLYNCKLEFLLIQVRWIKEYQINFWES